ncbi:MAG: M1 family metallopeptidase [Chloroflexi bacterium]|nr:M1 family metallopeptidase [Chloroflexota bacterium]MDA1173664.1 M1 family metallopeptidase [Chloroflexota bacterium]
MTSSSPHRLPANVRPVRYAIELAPDLTSFTFTGSEKIAVQVAEPTWQILLNAAEMEITAASVTLADGTSITASASVDEDAERATLLLESELPAGEATLSLTFNGTLNDQLRGFYRSQYEGPDGNPRFLATTQFEATDARRAFPCWDEPQAKAVFDVTLVVPSDLVAVSNMPVASESTAVDGTKAVHFEATPRMSTYLVVFVVGDLASVEATSSNGTLVRVFATRGKEEQGRFALENSLRILDYMNDYFGIDYPLPKMDHLAIPDFAAGAMENWGAITYRETALLFDPENSAAQSRQRILEVVAHEMAHMWFGDLVTMEWWDDLWLNESFASWMGDKAVDFCYPEWEMWTQFVSMDTNSALSLDGLRSSHPIEANVDDPAEIRELFDAISYSKGGSVLRMLEDFLGAETFQRGLHDYLKGHEYGNARTEHLWSALADASSKPVTAIMNSWVKQTGYPVVDVDINRSGAEPVLGLRQQRFLYDHLLDAQSDATVWQVPVSIASAGSTGTSLLMEDSSASVSLSGAEGWIKANAGQTGFFRANYAEDEWDRLRDAVAAKSVSAVDRLGLQNDAYALMRSGRLPATVFLSLAEAFSGETDAPVWGDFASNLKGLEGLLLDAPFIDGYRDFGRSVFDRIADATGWDAKPGEQHLDALLRSTVLGQHGGYGGADTIEEAKRRFAGYLNDPTSLHPDLRGLVFSLVAQNGDRTTYDTLWKLHKEATLAEEKVRILGALTRFSDKALLQDLLDRSMGDEVRSQDTMIVVVQAAGNKDGRDLTWQFIKDNWAEFDRRYGKGGFAIMRIVGITGGFTSMERHDEVERFFEEHPTPSAARTIQQSLERIRLSVRWLELNRDAVGSWLAAR